MAFLLFFSIVIGALIYLYGILGACNYFEKNCLEPNLIRLFIVICPIWNLYFAFKYSNNSENFSDFLTVIKNQFKIGK